MVPDGWRAGCVLNFFKLQRGFDLTKSQAVLGDVPVYSSSGISYYHSKAKVDAPGIVTGRKGSIGPVYYIEKPFWPHDTSLWVSEFKGSHPKFVWYFLQNMKLERLDEASSVPTLNRNNVHRQKCLFPPLPEQQKIAEILSIWDRAIETTEALLATARTQKRALMQTLLTGKRRFPEFEGQDWHEVRLRDVLKEVKRPVIWNDDELYRLISVRRRSGGLFHREDLYGRDILTKTLKHAQSGDFLISKMQVVHGAMGLVRSDFDGMQISNSYIAVRSRDPKELLIEFFDWLSRLPEMYHRAYFCSYGVHIEKMTFNFDLFLKEKISLPSTLGEQQAIVDSLDAAEGEERSLEAQIEKLRTEKKALMQQLLTGKRRVQV